MAGVIVGSHWGIQGVAWGILIASFGILFPLLFLFLSIWAAAEFTGYVAGEGDSSRKVV